MAERIPKGDPEEWESLIDRLLPEEGSPAAPRPEVLEIYSSNDRIPAKYRELEAMRAQAMQAEAMQAQSMRASDPSTAQQTAAERAPATTPRRRIAESLWLAWPVAAAILAFTLGWLASAPCSAISPDSVQYLSAARNIAEGHGLTTSVTPLEIGLERVPFSAWPPLYPMLLALGERWNLLLWSRLLNVAMFALGLFPLAYLAKQLLGARWMPFALIAYAGFRPALLTSSFVWSESCFTLWVLISLACLIAGLEAANRSESRPEWDDAPPVDPGVLWIVGAGLFASLATLTRYTGVALLVAGGVTLVLRSTSDKSVPVLHRLLAFLIPATAPIFAWCLRNQRLTGHLFGEERAPSLQSPAAVILDTLRTLTDDWVLPPAFADARLQTVAVWIAGIASVVIVLVLVQRFGPQMMERDRPGHTTGVALSAFAIVYLLLMVVSTMRISTDPINSRLLFPAYPSLVLLGVMLFRGAQDGANVVVRRGVVGIALFFFALHLTTGARYITAPRETQNLTSPYWRSVIWAEPSYVPPEAALLASIPDDALVISNVWDRVALHTSHPVKPLPGRDERAWAGSVLQHGNAYVLVDQSTRQNRVGTPELDAIGSFPPGLDRVADRDGVRLYRVRTALGPKDLPRGTPVR